MFAWQWLDLLKSMLKEAEWTRNNSVPTMDEYITNAYVTVAMEPILLPSLYFVGPKLSEEVIKTPEFRDLVRLVSACTRLLNDIQSFEVEFSPFYF